MSQPLQVHVVGVGRMGSLLAKAMSPHHRVTIYQRNEEKGRQVAAEIGCQYAQAADALPSADAVVLALPAEVTGPVLESLRALLRADTVVINTATKVLKDSLRPILPTGSHLVGAKIVGQFRGMDEQPIVVIDADTERGGRIASQLFASLGAVQPGDERTVLLANSMAAREICRAAITVEEALKDAGVRPEIINSALRVVAIGCLRAYIANDLGPFGRDMLREVQEAKTAKRV